MATTGRREAQVFVFRAGEGEYLVRPGTYIAHKSVGDHVIRNLTDDPVTVTFGHGQREFIKDKEQNLRRPNPIPILHALFWLL